MNDEPQGLMDQVRAAEAGSGPLKLTWARFFNKCIITGKDHDGHPVEKWSKVLAHRGALTQFEYGTDTESDFNRSGLQVCLIGAPHTGVFFIDVDAEAEFMGRTRLSRIVGRQDAISTRADDRFHILVDARNVPPDQWPRQGPVFGGDIKSNGWIPRPGSEHYSGELYQPVIHPGHISRIVPATLEMLAAIAADRAECDAHRGPAGQASANGSGSYTGGTGGGHDGEIAAQVIGWVRQAVNAGHDPADPAVKEAICAAWQQIAIPQDPDWPFRRDDFERHYRTAVQKVRSTPSVTATPEALAHAQRATAAISATAEDGGAPVSAGPARSAGVYPAPSNPMACARRVVEDLYRAADGAYKVIWWRDDFYSYTGTHWGLVYDPVIQGDLYRLLEHAEYLGKKDKDGEFPRLKWAPSRDKIGSLIDALAKGVVQYVYDGDPPAWMGTGYDTDLLPMANGLLQRSTRQLYPHSPLFFSTWALRYAYDPAAPVPKRWTDFLASCWPADAESPALLQEWFGYVLSGDTNLQKILLAYGPMRSGKGTIMRVLRGLIGPQNVASPTLASLSREFGMEGLIGKPLVGIPDARLRRADTQMVVERLLSVSGEDALSVPRKYKTDWEGRLPGRIMMVTNEMPRFDDVSGALPSRFVPLIFKQNWLGREDVHLTADLLTVLPGILNWALEGMDRVRGNGYFTATAAAAEAMASLVRLTSPVQAFIDDRLLTGPALLASPPDVYQAWLSWCAQEGREHPGTAETLGRDLRAVLPGLAVIRPRGEDGRQARWYQGIAVRPITG